MGEEWLLEPRRVGDHPGLWSPGIKLGVRRGSFFHRTECFGPVLGLMRAGDLDEAIDLANDTPFGLTSGIQSLDDREIDRWLDRIEAGNLYVNRHTTGAIVSRQPFGGWKASSVGPGAKAGGPNYTLQLARWRQVELPGTGAEPSPEVSLLLERCLAMAADERERTLLRVSAASYAHAWQNHFGTPHETSRLLGERNVFRYRRCRHVLVRGEVASSEGRSALCQVLLAACTCGVPVTISLSSGEGLTGSLSRREGLTGSLSRREGLTGSLLQREGVTGSLSRGEAWAWLVEHAGVSVFVDSEEDLIRRLRTADGVDQSRAAGGADRSRTLDGVERLHAGDVVDRLRALEPTSAGVRTAAHEAGMAVIDAPVLATGRLELRWYVREQTISRVTHRYGNVIGLPRPDATAT